jgi:hypothetical protein
LSDDKDESVLAWIALGGAVETTVIITNWDEAKTSLKSMYVLDGVPVAALDPIPWTSF